MPKETTEKKVDEKFLMNEIISAQKMILKYQGAISTCESLIKYLKPSSNGKSGKGE